MTDWFTKLQKAKKSCMVSNNLKKVRYEFEDGKEMVEEYNTDTNVITRRAWKYNNLKNEGEWDIEVGDPEPSYNKEEANLIKEDASQPFVSRRITRINLEWRIRNLPYPIETYSVTVDKENTCLTVRTNNKKYFKKLSVPDLERLNISLEQENVSFSHKFNTLIITYKKPQELLAFEKAVWQEVEKIKPQNCGDIDNCKPS